MIQSSSRNREKSGSENRIDPEPQTLKPEPLSSMTTETLDDLPWPKLAADAHGLRLCLFAQKDM